MEPGGCSDVSRIHHQDGELLSTDSLQAGETGIWYPAVTLTWMDWILKKGEPDSDWYDFAEERPVWTMWWFRTGAVALCIGLIWIFWPVV